MEIDKPISSVSNIYLQSNASNVPNDNPDSDEYEEEVSYIIMDLGTEVTLDMITNNFEILNNINPSSFNFNQNRNHQNREPLSASTSDFNNNEATQKPFHYYLRPSTSTKKGCEDGESDFNSKKENNDIDYSLIGLDTDTPYLRIDNIHFKGEYDETIGTDLIFFPEPDPLNPRQQKLTYQCHTTKKIKFSQVNLQEINLHTTNELKQLNIDDDNEWGDKYSVNNKKFSLNDLELFNTKSDFHDDSNDENNCNDNDSQNETVVDKGKRKVLLDHEKGDKMELD